MRIQICLDLLIYEVLVCTTKTSCKFQGLKQPPHYKQSIYSIKLQKQLVCDDTWVNTFAYDCLKSKTSTNSYTASQHAPPTGVHSLNGRHLYTLDMSVAL